MPDLDWLEMGTNWRGRSVCCQHGDKEYRDKGQSCTEYLKGKKQLERQGENHETVESLN